MKKNQEELAGILTKIKSIVEMEKFLQEICSPKEIADMALRWRLLEELYFGKTQRKIVADYRISLCKITRGSKILKEKNSISYKILKEKYGEIKNEKVN